MPDKPWTPDAPSLTTHFEHAHDDREAAPAPGQVDPGQGISTSAELKQLEETRARPELTPKLSIGGAVEQAINQKEEADKELRARFLRRSLQKASDKLRGDFDRTRGRDDDRGR